MSFKTDRQTLEELNLLGKFRQGSVYRLFNQVRTRSGEKLFDEWFNQPLTDMKAINNRVDVFRFFQQNAITFPLEPEQVALTQEYLDNNIGKKKLSTAFSLAVKRTLHLFTRDEAFRKVIQGLQASITVIKKCYALTEALHTPGGPFQYRVERVRKLLTHADLQPLLNADIYSRLSFSKLVSFDHLLRSKHNEGMMQLLDFIAEVDVCIAVSTVCRNRKFTYAEALPAAVNRLSAKNLYHPVVPNAVGNSIHMEQAYNVIFLTGANMAGKSTWMKSIGISVYLAHIGFPVAADYMQFSVREGIFSSINVADNIGLGYSHFYAEVVRVKQAAEAAATGKHLLLIFDELFKGTNVKDAYDGTLAVTEAFAEYRNCLFIVSTHIIEVGDALRSYDNIRFTFMPTIMEGTVPKYTYKLQSGITQDRQGMMIIRNENILEMLEKRSSS